MPAVTHVTAVIINFQTPDLTGRAVASFRGRYPAVPLLLIDNGSRDNESAGLLRRLQDESPGSAPIELLLNDRNLHHGPAMDQALRALRSPFVLFLDSDCTVLKGGFLEPMLARLGEKTEHYAIGHRIFMNGRGFDVAPGVPGAIAYVRPICMLVRRELYLTLPPFERHGTPCLANMKAAADRGLALLDFPVGEYLHHEGRGTAGRFGYRLGFKGKLNHLLNRLGL